MNFQKAKRIRTQITEDDLCNARSFIIECGSTALDGFNKLSKPQQEMLVASLCCFGEQRAQFDRSQAYKMRALRLDLRLSCEMMAAKLNDVLRERGLIDAATVARIEARPSPREKTNARVVQAFESVLGYGWEYLCEAVKRPD
jgi:hypothetical protein